RVFEVYAAPRERLSAMRPGGAPTPSSVGAAMVLAAQVARARLLDTALEAQRCIACTADAVGRCRDGCAEWPRLAIRRLECGGMVGAHELLRRQAKNADQRLAAVHPVQVSGHGGADIIEDLPPGAREPQLVHVLQSRRVIFSRRQDLGR